MSESLCVWAENCRRRSGHRCPPNCLWSHTPDQAPNCLGFYLGHGITAPGSREAAIVLQACVACDHIDRCRETTEERFGPQS